MKLLKPSLAGTLLLLLLTGCWDQNLLSKSILLLTYGIDLSEDGKIINTLAIVSGDKKTEVMSLEGRSPRDTRLHINMRLPGNMDASKNRVVLISEEAARKGIYPYLDVLYRDPKSALNAKIGIVEGSVEKMLRQYAHNPAMRKFDAFFNSMEKSTAIPVKTVETACHYLFESGQDNLLPYLSMDKHDQIVVGGSALFHKEYYTGKLTKDETELALLMMGQLAETAQLQIQTKEAPGVRGVATANVLHAKEDIKVRPSGGKVEARVNLELDLHIIEHPLNHLEDEKRLLHLEQLFEEQLNDQAKTVLKKLQKARCDALGIGTRLHAFHPQQWKKMNWEENYAQVEFIPHVKVKITGMGIIN